VQCEGHKWLLSERSVAVSLLLLLLGCCCAEHRAARHGQLALPHFCLCWPQRQHSNCRSIVRLGIAFDSVYAAGVLAAGYEVRSVLPLRA
jgi:hypothetical protein